MYKIIAVCGMSGTGKSEVVKYLENKGLFRIYFGQATIDEINHRGLDVNEANEKMVREELRKQYGMAAYAIINLEKITRALSQNNVVIDGLYSWSEYKFLKEKFGDNLLLLAVTAPFKLRLERLANRPVRPLSKAEVSSRDIAEIENIEKSGPIAIADYTVVNNGTLEQLYKQLTQILKDIN